MTEDSIEGIYETLKRCALISKTAGGIGLSVNSIRANNSYISGTNGQSNGLVPMLRVYNDTARYVDQGGGKRKGAFAIYLEPWHADIFDFLDLKKNHGKEEARARDLFYALWIPDLFMKRVEANAEWSLMCPNEVSRRRSSRTAAEQPQSSSTHPQLPQPQLTHLPSPFLLLLPFFSAPASSTRGARSSRRSTQSTRPTVRRGGR